ncbi:MAG: hypothetical protein WA085_12640 [Sphingobium sp.]
MKSDISINKKWKTEDDLRTLLSAKEIQKDKTRMAAVKKLAGEKSAELKNLQAYAAEEAGEKD